MTEYKSKYLKGLGKKTAGPINATNLLLESELLHVDEYQSCEDLCKKISEAEQALRQAAFRFQEAERPGGIGRYAG